MTIGPVTDQSELSQVARMFEEIVATLPPGCATLRCKEEGEKAPAEVAILPVNEGSAEFGAMFFGRRLYGAFFGREPLWTTYEAPWELNLDRRDGVEKQLAALRKMCEAVVAGRCEHLVTMFSLLGTIRAADGSVFRVCDLPCFHPRRLRERIVYEPYDRDFETDARLTGRQSV